MTLQPLPVASRQLALAEAIEKIRVAERVTLELRMHGGDARREGGRLGGRAQLLGRF